MRLRDWPGIFFEKNNVVIKIHGIKLLSEILIPMNQEISISALMDLQLKHHLQR